MFTVSRIHPLLVAGTAILLMMGTLSPASAESVLRIKLGGALKLLDPTWTTSYPVRDHGYIIYDTLFSTDADFKVQPQMVETYDLSADGKAYTFTLRDHLNWHDGAPVTPADCIASLERWMKKDNLGRVLASRLDHFETVDAKTFKMVLKAPWGLTIEALGKISSYVPFILPERLIKAAGDKDITDPTGSGPFIMKADEWVPGSKVVYVKNPNYVPRNEPPSGMAGGKVAKVDRIERIDIPDEMSAINALIAGEIDYISAVPEDMAPLVQDNSEVSMMVREALGRGTQVVLNHLLPPFDNVKARHAVQWALNQRDFMEARYGNHSERYTLCPSMLYCGGLYESAANSERLMQQDFEKSKALLKDAGYDGTPIVVLHPTDEKVWDDAVTVLIQTLRRVGFVIDEQIVDMATVYSRRTSTQPADKGGWHIFITGWGGVDLMSPATNVFMTGACEKAWYGWPCDKELQKLHAAFFEAPDEAARKEIAEKLHIRSMDVVTYLPMGIDANRVAFRNNVKGVLKAQLPVFWNMSKEE